MFTMDYIKVGIDLTAPGSICSLGVISLPCAKSKGHTPSCHPSIFYLYLSQPRWLHFGLILIASYYSQHASYPPQNVILMHAIERNIVIIDFAGHIIYTVMLFVFYNYRYFHTW